MPVKTLLAALVALAILAAAGPATAGQPHRYTLHGKHKHCRKGYRHVKRPHKVFCIRKAKRKASAKASGPVRLHAHLDPTYTRNPLDPFEITYAYSASATQEPSDAAISDEAPAPLPKGVLSLYSDGILECSINVGGSATGDDCPVSYASLGRHKVTTIYTSGEESATATELEDIQPLASSVLIAPSYEALAESIGSGNYDWLLGYVVVNGTATNGSGAFGLACRPTDGSNCLLGSLDAGKIGVEGRQCGVEGMRNDEPICFARLDGESAWHPVGRFEDGSYFLRGTQAPVAAGYLSAEATAPLIFTPTVTFPACDAEHGGPWC